MHMLEKARAAIIGLAIAGIAVPALAAPPYMGTPRERITQEELNRRAATDAVTGFIRGATFGVLGTPGERYAYAPDYRYTEPYGYARQAYGYDGYEVPYAYRSTNRVSHYTGNRLHNGVANF